MKARRHDRLGATAPPAEPPRQRDLRWQGRTVRVTTPVPAGVWATVAAADPATMAFQTPAWRDCVCSGSGWHDASRLYETPDGRPLVLMMARRPGLPAGLAVEASWPPGWGTGGLLAPGGVRPDEVALVSTDLARGRAISASVRPGFRAAPAWRAASGAAFVIPRAVHVAHFGGPFTDFWEQSVTPRGRANIKAARRKLDSAGITITDGNSPALLEAFYRVYLRWIDRRAAQRGFPAAVARWQARRAEPFSKFTAVASRLGEDCRIWVAWWDGRPVGATISLYAGETAIGWRCFADRSVSARFRLSEILMTESLKHACDSGCRYLEMGESVGKASLANVKERIGGQEHTFAEYCFDRLPLSRGRIAFQRARGRAEDWILSRRPPADAARTGETA